MKIKRKIITIATSLVLVVSSFAYIPARAQGDFFVAYAYCPCKKCCGKSDGITASGVRAMEGRTIAVDKSVIPLGSTVLIYVEEELYGIFVAEDTGVKGNTVDIFFESHQAALIFGMKEVTAVVIDAKG